ncbi:MAG: Ada metal-binding domain-containing protein [Stellaceae bacterium]
MPSGIAAGITHFRDNPDVAVRFRGIVVDQRKVARRVEVVFGDRFGRNRTVSRSPFMPSFDWAYREPAISRSPESDSVPVTSSRQKGRAAMLDDWECERARVGRDPTYDGRFFTAVRTTGIYCRPVCPVRPARPANVRFFPTAAAAEAAGFRPCLRCRPETAPFCPAWRGSRATVERAARLIVEDGAMDGEGASVEALAERVGIGARQLGRLFARYLNASPSQVAKTARVQRAKRLLDETDLPLTEIALHAGFNSVRRFNSVFAETYRRPPSEIRRERRTARPR